MKNTTLLNNRLPFGNTKFILGILAIIFSPFIGFILGTIAVLLVSKDNNMLQSFPDNYSEIALKNHKVGTILSYVGFLVSILTSGIILYYYFVYGTLDLNMIDQMKASGQI